MGREIRRVPPNWEHPKREDDSYQPMYDNNATDCFAEWMEDFEEFKNHKLAEVAEEYGYDKSDPYFAFCDWHGCPPDHEYYHPNWEESDVTWWQVYETVSEGTPVTPPFETQEELVGYLVENGDFWDQRRRNDGGHHFMNCDPWSRKQAESFVFGAGWAPSMVMDANGIRSGVEALVDLKD